MIVKIIDKVPAVPVKMDGASNVTVRILLGPNDGAPTMAMRLFELAPNGNTPYHNHPYEHEVIVLSGKLAAVTENGQKELSVGDVVLMEPDEQHQFKNLSDTDSARMICLIPVQFQK